MRCLYTESWLAVTAFKRWGIFSCHLITFSDTKRHGILRKAFFKNTKLHFHSILSCSAWDERCWNVIDLFYPAWGAVTLQKSVGWTCSVPQPSSIQGLATPRTYFLHLCLTSVILMDSSTESPVHVLMLSIQAVRGLPRQRAPGVVPCIISFSRQLPCFLVVWPLYASFLALTVSNSSLFTPSLVKYPLICFPCCPWKPQNLSQFFHYKGAKACFFILSCTVIQTQYNTNK